MWPAVSLSESRLRVTLDGYRAWSLVRTVRRSLRRAATKHLGCGTWPATSPDGKTLASGSQDKTIRLWDVASRQPLAEPLTGHRDSVMSVAFSPDGKTLAS